MAKQKCSPKTRNSRNRNWRRMLIVVFRPFMTGERTTRTAHAILNYETISRRASEPKLTTASGCLLLPASFSSIRRTLRRSEEHTSELQSRLHLVCRLLLEKKKNYYVISA